MTTLKQSRWVKVHERGDANYAEVENVMDVLVGANCHQAESAYTVRSFKKAAYWMLKYLEYAGAKNLCDRIRRSVETAAAEANRGTPDIELAGDGWSCSIARLAREEFKVRLKWEEQTPETSESATRTRTRRSPKK